MPTSNDEFRIRAMQQRVLELERENADLKAAKTEAAANKEELDRLRAEAWTSKATTARVDEARGHEMTVAGNQKVIRLSNLLSVSHELFFRSSNIDPETFIAENLRRAAVQMVEQSFGQLIEVDAVQHPSHRQIDFHVEMNVLQAQKGLSEAADELNRILRNR